MGGTINFTLQSLAGARPKNDVIVRLEEVIWAENRLKIARSPIQVSGRFYGLVSIVSTQGEWLTVRHYNPESDRFDGVEEVIRFRKGRLFSTPQQLEASPAGEAGWYIYGATPQIQAWLQQHPNHPQTQRFQALVALGKELEQNLTPLGVVRSDWKQNAETLAGVGDRLIQDNDLFAGILSWRTIMPRRGQDIIADLLLDKKAKLWVLQSFQVPGGEESIFPVAPTVLLGQVPVLSTLLIRVVTGLITLPSGWGWLICVSIGLGYAAIAVPFGLMTGFLQFRWDLNWNQFFLTLVFPAFSEELVFRGLLLPSFLENANVDGYEDSDCSSLG
ncbi:hypothetical protein [Coleofasciculus sp. F4-SAH-05]|uniref:hypothetical protein n=1 Tax=Coleofasciculus sp. F4-SAH-05 TaxID=3069525 RepID=UPI0032FA3FE0